MLAQALPGGLRAPFVACALGRLPGGAIGLVLVLLTHERTGSFADGGLVAAACAIGFAVGAPLFGRRVDRRGQVRVLLAAALLHAGGLLTVALMPDGAPLIASVAAAGVAGIGHPPLGSAMRAIWNQVLDPAARHAAYALDAVMGEVLYILGPLVLVAGIGTWSFEAATLSAAAAVVVGTAAYVATHAVRTWTPSAASAGPRDPLGALRGRGVLTLAVSALLFGAAIAGVELGVASFSEAEGHKGATGLILALWGVGSMLGGVWAARRGPAADAGRDMALWFGLVALTTLPLMFAPSLTVLAVLIVPAGFFIAPALTVVFTSAADVAPPGTVAEANAWMSTGIGAGIGLGGAVAGGLVESLSPVAGFAFGIAFLTANTVLLVVQRGIFAREPAMRVTTPA